MKKSNLKKVLIPLTIAIFLFSFASIVHATGESSNVTIRPLSHWTHWNPQVIKAYRGPDPNTGQEYAIFFSFWWWNDPPSPLYPEPSWYEGYVKERELLDGRAEITVHIDFQDWKIRHVRFFPQDPFPGWGGYQYNLFNEDLTMSGKYTIKFILTSPNEWDQYLPNIAYMEWMGEEVGLMVSDSITATGSGTLSDYAATKGFSPGATAKVTLVQRALWNPPVADPIDGMWPAEIVNIQEMPN